MNKIKQNAFWVGLGVAGAALVAFFLLAVVPATLRKGTAHSGIMRLRNVLKDQGAFAGNEDIKSFEEAKAKYKDNYEKIGIFYAKSKEHLERWFPALNVAASQDPARDAFMGMYRNEGAQIEKTLRDKGVKVGIGVEDETGDKKPRFGFNWEDPGPDEWPKVTAAGDEKKVVKEIQKRFWARQRVANAILSIANEGGKVNRVHDFRFFRKLHPQLNGPWEMPPQNENAVNYMGVGVQHNMIPQNFVEFDLPQKLGRTMTFGFALELPYSQVPRIISEILNPAAEKDVAARLLVSVIGTHITIREQNTPEVLVRYMEGDLADKQKKVQEAKDNTKPIDVLLTVTCQIIDFEPTELQKFDVVADAK
jgi:hypothetical protein